MSLANIDQQVVNVLVVNPAFRELGQFFNRGGNVPLSGQKGFLFNQRAVHPQIVCEQDAASFSQTFLLLLPKIRTKLRASRPTLSKTHPIHRRFAFSCHDGNNVTVPKLVRERNLFHTTIRQAWKRIRRQCQSQAFFFIEHTRTRTGLPLISTACIANPTSV